MAKAKDTLTVGQKLKALNQLQQVDSRLDEFSVLKGELPMEVEDLEDEIAGLQTRIGNIELSIAEQKDEVGRHHANVAEAQDLIVRYKKQLDEVKNNREFEALSKEVELQSLEIQLSEKRIREANNVIKNKEATLEVSRERLSVKEKDLENKKIELEKIIADTEKEEAKLLRKQARARKKIEPRFLKAYDKIRGAYRNGLAVVTVERDACGGCFNRIPPQVQVEITHRKKVLLCEHCGRVLVDELIDEVES
ncbi:MAG: putative nucleic acid-binding Zn-ribbon protein [Cognaticolwellia sp.]|jgi:predicted  nucleic acid-binding Zn-ribbon protein